MSKTIYRVDDIVPKTGKYRCIICDYVMEFTEGDKFVVCPVCLAGQENGPIDPHEDFWEIEA
jgi:rubrerythrin